MKKKGKIILVVVIGVCLLGLTLVALTNQEMRRGFLGEVPTAEEISERQIMKERLDLLKRAAKREFDVSGWINDKLYYSYSVKDFSWSYGIVEYVWVHIGVHIEGQKYVVMGRGEEVFEVDWKKEEFNPQRTLKYTVKKKGNKLKYEANYEISREYHIDYSIPKGQLSEEEAKELFDKGRQHYLEAREFFGVDTNEGLKKAMRKLEFK